MLTQIVGTAYLSTIQGICKIVELVCSLIAALLVGIQFYGWVINLFEIGAAVSIIVSAFLLIMYTTGAAAKVTLSWNRFQFFFHIIWAIFYIIVIAILFSEGSGFDRIVAGGVFGILATIAHIIDGIDNYKKQPLF